MLAVLVQIELHIPASRSLKDKRGVIKRLMRRLRDDLGVSVAEVDHQDLWQRATLGIAIATGEESVGRQVVQDVDAILGKTWDVEVLDTHVEVVQPDFDGFSMARAAQDPRLSVDGVVLDGVVIDVPVDRAGHPLPPDEDWIGET